MKPSVTAALAVLLSVPAFAANAITLDFEGVAGYVNPIASFYNGGIDGQGRVGPNDGVVFTDSAVALSNDASFQYFSHAPTPTTALFAFDANAFMNVAGGFVDSLLFYYSSAANATNAVNLYSGLDATGTRLASFSLLGNAQTGCNDTPYCRFDAASVRFAGIARSVSFGTVTQDALFDNLSFTPAVAAAVPEPSTWALLVAGIVALAVAKRRSLEV